MDVTIQPILLLADSQLLFWRDGDELFLERVRRLLEPTGANGSSPTAAYVGASNGDQPEFYQLFQGAMSSISVTDCRMIPSEPSADDLEFFDSADLILLAGGDVEQGFSTFEQNGLKQKIIDRYYAGAVLIGLSAGAVQIGLHGSRPRTEPEADSDTEIELFDTLRLVPLMIDAHQEPEWQRLKGLMPLAGDYIQGLGIPSGAGAFVHPDMTVEPVRRPLVELSIKEGEVRQNLLLPPDEEHEEAPTD